MPPAYWDEQAELAWAPVPDASLGRHSLGGGPKEGPGDAGEPASLSWPGSTLDSPWKSWRWRLG